MRILLTGVNGQLGGKLLPVLREQGEVTAVGRADCDLTDVGALRQLVRRVAPEVIVNAAAYTRVNDAETNRELAMAVNGVAPGVLAEEAKQTGALMVHYSTDYVFDGSKHGPYTEDDATEPLNVYGASKLAGEQAVQAAGGRHLILRTSWVYGATGNNFLLTILRLAAEREELQIVDDQVGSPTSTAQLARATVRLVERYGAAPKAHGVNENATPSGVYHLTAAGSVSWCGFARAIVAASVAENPAANVKNELNVRRIVGIPSCEYPAPARRPLNSVLCNQKFARTFGFQLEDWPTALAEVMGDLSGVLVGELRGEIRHGQMQG